MPNRFCIWTLLFCISIGFAQLGGSQTIVDSIPAPAGETRGLAWDGTFLWNSDDNDTIYQLDPSTGAVVSSFYFYVGSGYGGLTWSGDGKLWMADGDYIYKIDPTTGDIVYSFSCPGG